MCIYIYIYIYIYMSRAITATVSAKNGTKEEGSLRP